MGLWGLYSELLICPWWPCCCYLSRSLLRTHLSTLSAGFFSFRTLWASDFVDAERQRAAAERLLLWRTPRRDGSAMHSRWMWHLLPGLPEGVPAEGVLGRALQLRHRLNTRARWEYIFFTQEWQSQDGAAVQLCMAGESKYSVLNKMKIRTT